MLGLEIFKVSEKIPDCSSVWPSGKRRVLVVLSADPLEYWACAHQWSGYIDESTGKNGLWAELNHSSSQGKTDIIAWALLPEESDFRL